MLLSTADLTIVYINRDSKTKCCSPLQSMLWFGKCAVMRRRPSVPWCTFVAICVSAVRGCSRLSKAVSRYKIERNVTNSQPIQNVDFVRDSGNPIIVIFKWFFLFRTAVHTLWTGTSTCYAHEFDCDNIVHCMWRKYTLHAVTVNWKNVLFIATRIQSSYGDDVDWSLFYGEFRKQNRSQSTGKLQSPTSAFFMALWIKRRSRWVIWLRFLILRCRSDLKNIRYLSDYLDGLKRCLR